MRKIFAIIRLVLLFTLGVYAQQSEIVVDKRASDTKEKKSGEASKVPAQVKISGFTQFSYTSDPTLGGIEPFAVKTARVGFSWKFNDWAEFKIQPDFYGFATSTSITTVTNISNKAVSVIAAVPTVNFKELWAEFIADKDLLRVKVGQYLVPFSFENNYPASKAKVFDTPQFLSKTIIAKYDYGIQLCGNLPGDNMKNLLSWRVGILNGTTYGSETDGMKDFSGYFVTKPINDFEFGISAYTRHIAACNKYETHYGFYGKYETEGTLPLFTTFEYIAGKDTSGVKDIMDFVFTVEAKPFVMFLPSLSCLAPVFRFERWDENIWDGSYVSYYTVGLNIYADKSVRFLADYVIKSDTIPDNNKFNTMVQINY